MRTNLANNEEDLQNFVNSFNKPEPTGDTHSLNPSRRMHRYWPVPESYENKLPEPGEMGSFWEDREDRYHCGIDLYCDEDAIVLAIESGLVINKTEFTSYNKTPYHETTYSVLIKSKENVIYKYCELKEINVKIGDFIFGGQQIGTIAKSLNPELLDFDTPFYIRELVQQGYLCMLHLELYKSPISEVQPYQYGNFLGRRKPDSVINPFYYLNGLEKK
ncbi:MAG: M23 family metallopeptidase [Candidatus Kapabacteria bacterium]|nr:M23 family metallopeptidase [Candidatus Kapabacteria bacterium]